MLSTTQQGYRIHSWGTTPVWETFSVSVPQPGEALVDVEACSVGLTVLNCIDGHLSDDPAALPRVPGHELVGTVTQVGATGDQALIGQRVMAYFYLHCGICLECLTGEQSRCRNLAGWVGVHRDGGYAPSTVLPVRNLVAVPDGMDSVTATVVPDAVATPVHVTNRAQATRGDRAVVIGAGGGVGAHMIQLLELAGAEVAGFDVTDAKLAMIEDLGVAAVASHDIDSIDPNGLFTTGRPTIVIDFVGTIETVTWAQAALQTGGRFVIVTTFRNITADLDPRQMVFRELSIIGSRYATVNDLSVAAQLVNSGKVKPIIGATTGPHDVLDLHEQLKRGDLIGRGALIWKR